MHHSTPMAAKVGAIGKKCNTSRYDGVYQGQQFTTPAVESETYQGGISGSGWRDTSSDGLYDGG